MTDDSIQSSRADLVREIKTLGKEKERLEREISDTRAAASIHAEEHRKLRAQLKIAQDALEWEEHRCGKLHGPLWEALKKLRCEP